MKNAFTGSWRITDMELWDEEARDFSGPRTSNSEATAGASSASSASLRAGSNSLPAGDLSST